MSPSYPKGKQERKTKKKSLHHKIWQPPLQGFIHQIIKAWRKKKE